MIEVFDNVLEEHNALLFHEEIKMLKWQYNYHSHREHPNKHWHILCGHNEDECGRYGHLWAHDMFEMFTNKLDFKKKYKVDGYERIYCNAHTHGIEPHLHVDDGQFTMIYYPRWDWKPERGGGTMVDGELVHYVGNRLVIFDAHLPHQAMPVSRECYELRTNVVFKCNVVDQAKKTIDFYKNAIGQGNYKIKFA